MHEKQHAFDELVVEGWGFGRILQYAERVGEERMRVGEGEGDCGDATCDVTKRGEKGGATDGDGDAAVKREETMWRVGARRRGGA